MGSMGEPPLSDAPEGSRKEVSALGEAFEALIAASRGSQAERQEALRRAVSLKRDMQRLEQDVRLRRTAPERSVLMVWRSLHVPLASAVQICAWACMRACIRVCMRRWRSLCQRLCRRGVIRTAQLMVLRAAAPPSRRGHFDQGTGQRSLVLSRPGKLCSNAS